MKKGFTLIELIVVVAIITILSGVIFTLSLNSFKNSKIKGFSNEALSLIKRLYDYQNSNAMFIDQVTDNDVEKNYNIEFKIQNEKLNIALRNKEEVIDEVLISNVSYIGDIGAEIQEEKDAYSKEVTTGNSYIFSFDSKGRVVSKAQDKPLNSLKINIFINKKGYKNSIIISTPPSGSIILDKGDVNE